MLLLVLVCVQMARLGQVCVQGCRDTAWGACRVGELSVFALALRSMCVLTHLTALHSMYVHGVCEGCGCSFHTSG